LLALAALAGLGWLAWSLTHPAAGAAAVPGAGAAASGSARSASGAASGGGSGAARRGPPPTTVGVAIAQRADIPVLLDALGTVTPAAIATVRPQVSGVLQQLMFREGQMVTKGQLLAQIDPRPFELALQQAIGQRQRDEAQLENARLTLERFRTLLGQDSIARQDVDTQAALVKQLEGTLVIDRANESTARLNLAYTRVTAPISGRLGLRVIDIGNLVSTSDAAGLAVITQLTPIDVEFAVPQDRVPELQQRLAGKAAAPLPATAFDRTRSQTLAQGRFLALDNVVDVQTGTVRAKARFDNPQAALFPSQFVNLRLQVQLVQGAVVVPVAALRHGNDGDFVWVLDPATRSVQRRTVQRGLADNDRVQITSGLQAGERVVTEGADRLKDGAAVVLPGPPGERASGAGRGGARAASGAASGAAHEGRRARGPLTENGAAPAASAATPQ
jgi:multidrug efflux system membrane fusion protein